MRILLSPQVREGGLHLARIGDVLTINGAAFDFAPLAEGQTLPAEAVGCDLILSDIVRRDGTLHLELVLPITGDAPEEARFPAPIVDPPNGNIVLPFAGEVSSNQGTGLIDWDAVISSSVSPEAINAERDRRMRGTFLFNGTAFNCDEASLQRITGAATLAGFAIGAGAQPGDLFWHGGQQPFGWIAADNSVVPMDAQSTFAFGRAAAQNESAHIFAARALKDMDPIPADFTDDQWWPA